MKLGFEGRVGRDITLYVAPKNFHNLDCSLASQPN